MFSESLQTKFRETAKEINAKLSSDNSLKNNLAELTKRVEQKFQERLKLSLKEYQKASLKEVSF
ncbi:MAG: hypothetical protein ACTSYA_01725 [Candidatus Kariarchaeaceae archaeon]